MIQNHDLDLDQATKIFKTAKHCNHIGVLSVKNGEPYLIFYPSEKSKPIASVPMANVIDIINYYIEQNVCDHSTK